MNTLQEDTLQIFKNQLVWSGYSSFPSKSSLVESLVPRVAHWEVWNL